MAKKEKPVNKRQSIFEINHRQQAIQVLKLAKEQENDNIKNTLR
jgi:hypothetical protein